ncbi:putative di- -cis-decaprenylcistransferase [Rosellinia necatrix]|uniref:ditrans,polycis-polyprenyl diphosphate synthase [(2E,6E)-farnesyldiphosphate specific] n=1 Tax=Rosellinia necatrix TaxID=77044 RepID=A0A1S7UJN5_ROSNE|nr:putative di- -cis-decaprenylcistransferase [Rosellinia necatrix]
MSFRSRDTQIYREDEKSGHTTLGAEDREELVKKHLPAPPARQRSNSRTRKQGSSRLGVRRFLKAQLYALLYLLVHAVFSLCIRIRIAYRAVSNRLVSILKHHYNSPEYIARDVATLKRLPGHLSIILTLENGGKGDALEKLVNEASEVAAWCAAAGIPTLSVYERTGVLKRYMTQTHRSVCHRFKTWFGKRQAPPLALFARGAPTIRSHNRQGLDLILVSEDDGREAMVDLTRVLTEMVQKEKIAAKDITMDVIDNELSEAVMREPDLLISFEPYVDLQGYPPWAIRLTEIHCSPDNQGVGYQLFLRALRRYAQATFKLGK